MIHSMPAIADTCGTALAEQRAYYGARAAEYDAWWLRQGRYDRGPEANAAWHTEGKEVARALAEFRPAGHVLELACGTGIWTEKLVTTADRVTAVDASSEMLALNAQRVGRTQVRHVQTDIFQWQPDAQFDAIFFGFWLSHVPPKLFETFWQLLASVLKPKGRVFLVDSRYEPSSTARDHSLPEPGGVTQLRRLDDGREFRVYKIFYEPAELTARLARLGWEFHFRETAHYFIHGSGAPI